MPASLSMVLNLNPTIPFPNLKLFKLSCTAIVVARYDTGTSPPDDDITGEGREKLLCQLPAIGPGGTSRKTIASHHQERQIVYHMPRDQQAS